MSLLKEIANAQTKKESRSFFSMADANKVEKMKLSDAKEYLIGKVEAMPKARPANIQKAKKMIDKAKSVKDLMFGVSNFIMSIGGHAVI